MKNALNMLSGFTLARGLVLRQIENDTQTSPVVLPLVCH